MATTQRIDTFGEPMPQLGGAGVWFIATAVAFIALGTLAIMAPFIAGLAVTMVVGWLLIVGGLMHVVNAFRGDSITRAAWQVFVGLFYLAAGLYFLAHPLIALGTLTASLACVLLVEAVMDLVTWFATRGEEGSSWLLANTLATFAVSTLIWMHWPSVSVWAIGTLVGVKLWFSGISRLLGRSGSSLDAGA
jgi:uncharacterized membrane protein HdeD (DUF308 family)